MKWFRFFDIFLCAAIIIILHAFGISRPLEIGMTSVIGNIGSPFYSARLSFTSLADGVRGIDRVERVRLMQEVLRLEKEQGELKMAQDENNILRKLLHFRESSTVSSVIARVIGESPDDASNSLVLDKGSIDGVQMNRAVITDDGVLVGKTFAVSDHISHVRLLSDSQSKIIAMILAKNSATGIVRGEFQISLTMDLIPITQKIHQSDLVVTAGREPDIPAGLLVGTVSDIKTRPTDFYQRATIRPFLDTTTIRLVSILN